MKTNQDFYVRLSLDDSEPEFIIGSNYEDGTSSTIFRGGVWYYRDPWTGEDRPVPGGWMEVFGHWHCHITEG